MSNFNIISLTGLIQRDSFKADAEPQNGRTAQEPQTPSNGVYIQDITGKLWKIYNWDGSVKPNAVAVITDTSKFLIALTESSSTMQLNSDENGLLDNYMTPTKSLYEATADYDGAGNTAKILKIEPSASYAAGYCNAFAFPDGKTKGFLPSLGQLYLAHQNEESIYAALSKCGGTVMKDGRYWSSTFWGVYFRESRKCWVFNWDGGLKNGDVNAATLDYRTYVRPFANF